MKPTVEECLSAIKHVTDFNKQTNLYSYYHEIYAGNFIKWANGQYVHGRGDLGSVLQHAMNNDENALALCEQLFPSTSKKDYSALKDEFFKTASDAARPDKRWLLRSRSYNKEHVLDIIKRAIEQDPLTIEICQQLFASSVESID